MVCDWTGEQGEEPTSAQVCVAVFLLLHGSRAAPPTILRGRVITLAPPEHDSSSTRKGTVGPGPPLAPATITIATRYRLTPKDSTLTRTEIVEEMSEQHV